MGGLPNTVQIKEKLCIFNPISNSFAIILSLLWITNFVESKSWNDSSVSQTPTQATERTDVVGWSNHGEDLANNMYYNYYDQYDPREIFKLDTVYCEDKKSCSRTFFLTFPDKLCHCDKLCGVLNDCCHNYDSSVSLLLTKDQFECVPMKEIVKNMDYGVTMVTKCFQGWGHNLTKTLCENTDDPEDILLRLPVTDSTDLSLMFKNMYCAQCNYVEDFQYWKPELICRNKTGMRSPPNSKKCTLFYLRPHFDVTYRTCQVRPSIAALCSKSLVNSDDSIRNCTEGTYSIVYDELGNMYRNEYCARCNGVQGPVFCDNLNPPIPPVPTIDPRGSTYSLKLLVNFNKGTVARNDEDEEEVIKCKDSEIYDSFSLRCREIFCAPPLMPMNGKCKSLKTNFQEAVKSSFNSTYTFSEIHNCTLFRLNPSEFEFTNNSELFIFSQQKVYSNESFRINGSDVFICSDKIQECTSNCKSSVFRIQSEIIESYLSLVGLVVSIVCLAFTLIVYFAFPQLLNTPGKILVGLIISLLTAHLLFVTAAEAARVQELCFTFGILIHYFFLAAFCWMNVIAVDLSMTFSNRFITPGSESKGAKRFILYSLYGWLVPLIIVLIAVTVDLVTENNNFRPGYGNEICWISSKEAVVLFFVGPLALFKLVDIVSFIFTAIHIARAQRQGRMATRKKSTCSLIINIKLSLIMGLTWVFAFVANVTNDTVTWYLFIIFNSLQGLFIAICFLCTKKVGRLLTDKYQDITTRLTSGTQITSLS